MPCLRASLVLLLLCAGVATAGGTIGSDPEGDLETNVYPLIGSRYSLAACTDSAIDITSVSLAWTDNDVVLSMRLAGPLDGTDLACGVNLSPTDGRSYLTYVGVNGIGSVTMHASVNSEGQVDTCGYLYLGDEVPCSLPVSVDVAGGTLSLTLPREGTQGGRSYALRGDFHIESRTFERVQTVHIRDATVVEGSL